MSNSSDMNLVTGASGFIGGRIVRALARGGKPIRVFARPDSDLSRLADIGHERCIGDITDKEAVKRAVKGCRRIFHAAAVYKLWVGNPTFLYRVNVEGTRHVMEAGLEAGVERIVHTSSVATIGLPDTGLGTEDTPVGLENMIGHYKKSKYLAEQVVLEFVRRGAPAVIVNPTYPVGIGDAKPTPSGRVIVDFMKGRMPAYLDTGLNVVDVDDVAEGHLNAALYGRVGERYILGHRNMTLKEILQTLATTTGLPCPRLKLPYYPVLALAYLDAGLARWIPGREPRIPPDGVRMSRKKMFVDPSKAVRELSLPQTSPTEALEKAVRWFRENDYV